jgi:hypothetical protein
VKLCSRVRRLHRPVSDVVQGQKDLRISRSVPSISYQNEPKRVAEGVVADNLYSVKARHQEAEWRGIVVKGKCE